MLTYYVIAINIIGFLFYLVNMWLYSHTEEGQMDKALTVLTLPGGSAGILLAILLFDRKAVKDNMMSRVFIIYLVAINFITFAAFAVDKVNAVTNRSRIRIVSLLGLAFIGGTVGGLFAMYLLRHKK